MTDNRSSSLVTNIAVALLAGVLGSVFTLLVTKNLMAPPLDQPVTINDNSLSEDSADESTSSVAQAFDRNDPLAGPSQPVDDQLNEDSIHSAQTLKQALDNASAERAQLADVLAQLTRQVESLEADAINRQAFDSLEEASLPEVLSADAHMGFNSPNDFGQSRNPRDRLASLVASGIDADRAQSLQTRQNQYELARLELFDQAEREGWTDSELFSERLESLNEQRPDLREELGDDAYDRYLFEAGRSNRVLFDSIIPGSSADVAGLQAGDLMLSYADRRVFSTSDLQRATRSGVRGEPVSMSIERQGQVLFFEVPRGPLGVSLSAQRRAPS